MKSKIIFFICFVLLMVYNQVHSAYFGPEILYMEYNEKLPGLLKSQEKGFLYGFRGGTTSCLAQFVYADIGIEFAQGKTKYSGTKQNLHTKEISPFKSISDNNLFNTEGSLGIILKIKPVILKPFGGFGYHIWERKLTDYSEKFNWIYFQFGGDLSIHITSFLNIGMEAKGFQTKFANIKIKDIYPWQQEMNLFNKLQYSIKLYNKFHSPHLNISLAAFYRNFNIGPSKNIKKSSFTAPESIDILMGSELILEYNF